MDPEGTSNHHKKSLEKFAKCPVESSCGQQCSGIEIILPIRRTKKVCLSGVAILIGIIRYVQIIIQV